MKTVIADPVDNKIFVWGDMFCSLYKLHSDHFGSYGLVIT